MKKKIYCILFSLTIMLSLGTVSLIDTTAAGETEYYVEEKIEILNITETRATSTKVAKKTSTVKNKNGESLWYVTVEGTFTYTGSSSTCTKSVVSAGIYNTSWKIYSKSSSKSGNKASATATADLYAGGSYIDSMTEVVSLYCGSTGSVW